MCDCRCVCFCFCQSDKRQFKLNWSLDQKKNSAFYEQCEIFSCLFQRHMFNINKHNAIALKEREKKDAHKTLTTKKKIHIKIKIKEENEMKEELNRNLFQGSILVLMLFVLIHPFTSNGHHSVSISPQCWDKSTFNISGGDDEWWRAI